MLRDKPKPENRNSFLTPFPLNLEQLEFPSASTIANNYPCFIDMFTQYIDTKLFSQSEIRGIHHRDKQLQKDLGH